MKPDSRIGWLIPALIVAVNAVAVLASWGSLPETLPAHFDLQGNAGGAMSRGTLLLFLGASAGICLAVFALSLFTRKRIAGWGFIILASGLALIIMSSTMVTLTRGTMPVFMLAEPVILLLSLAGFVICLVKAKAQTE